MDEENIIEETESTDLDFDDIWDDESPDDAEVESSESHETEEEPETDQSEENTEEEEAEESEGEEEEQKAADEQKDSYTLKHLDEVKTVSREEVIEYAQKGMDYDRIRQERDELRSGRDEFENTKKEFESRKAQLEGYEKFLNEMNEGSGKSLEQFMEDVEVRALMAKKANAGIETTEASARDEVRLRRERAAFEAEKDAFKNKAAEPEEKKDDIPDPQAEKRQKDILDFSQNFPEVKAEDIPQEVWQRVFKNGTGLSGEYALYENKKLKAEIKTLQQNAKNRERSTGSLKSSGGSKMRDIYDEVWDND